jgi:HPt (histidine-containing phosphotransfer) domain-containing protein
MTMNLKDPIIDQGMIQELLILSEPGYAFFLEIIDMYEKKSVDIIQEMEREIEMLNQGNFELQLIAQAHRFKGVNYNIGAQRLAAWCARLELACRSQEWRDVPMIFRDLQSCYKLTMDELAQIKSKFV